MANDLAGPAHIGWREWIYLPSLDIGPIKAKVDTGARTTALHAYDIQVSDGIAQFKVHTIQGRTDFFIQATAPIVEERLIRDSGGKGTMRPIVRVPITVCGQTFDVDVSLIDREDMSFRMLLGRSAITGRFLVDTASEYLGGVPPSVSKWTPP